MSWLDNIISGASGGPGITGGVSGSSSPVRDIVVNGSTYRLPAGVTFPPDGWYVWSNPYSEQWVKAHGGQLVKQGIPDPVAPPITATDIAKWKAEQEVLNKAAAQGVVVSTIDDLWKMVAAGGAEAEKALKILADGGNMLAKLSLSLGVAYATASAIAIGGAALIAIFLLKKK